MPLHEPFVATTAPAAKPAETVIPTRTVSTKSVPRPPVNADQATTVETPGVESPTADSVTLSTQASAKARQEQAYRQREQALKQRETDLAEKLKQAEQYTQLKAKLAAKDYSAVEELGVTYDAYTEHLLAKQTDEDPTAVELKGIKSEIDTLKKQQEEKAAKEYEATVAEYGKEIKNLVASNPDLTSVKELGREDAVLQLFLDEWEAGNEEVTVEQCAKDVEEFLVEEAKKYTTLTKLKSAEPERKLPKPGMKTLTNQVNVGATPPSTKPLSQMSDSERYAEARRRALAKRQG